MKESTHISLARERALQARLRVKPVLRNCRKFIARQQRDTNPLAALLLRVRFAWWYWTR